MAQLHKTQMRETSSHVQHFYYYVYEAPAGQGTYAELRRTQPRKQFRRINMNRTNLVAFAAALSVSGLCFAAFLA
jgi:hypothetical protein